MSNVEKFLKKPITKYIILFLLMLPVVPVGLNILYLNKYSGFSSVLRLNLSLILVFVFLSILMFGLYTLNKNKSVGVIIFTVISLLSTGFGSYFAFVNMRVYHSLNNMTTQETVINYSLVTMSDSNIKSIEDLKGKKIGTLNITKSEVLNSIEQFIEKNDLSDESMTTYDMPFDLIHDLYQGEVDAIIIGDNYRTIFSDQLGYEDIATDTTVIGTIETVIKEEVVANNDKNYGSLVDQPFSILLMGVDSEDQGLTAASRADSLILATINPQKLSITMTSLPRDSYVEIPCYNNMKDKINHANNGGTSCVIETVENWFDIDIPYYVKINFKGFVELIDALGGIYMYVPQTIVEQNSDRNWGDDIVYVEQGYQILDGEQALALARHRKTLANGDLGRAESQQQVIRATISQILTEVDTMNEVLKILDVLGNNIETNISMNQITSSFQYALDTVASYGSNNPLNYIHFKNMVISATFGNVYNELRGDILNYAFPFEGAVADARENMLINLEEIQPEMKYKFSYSPFSPHYGVEWVKSYYNEPAPELPEMPEVVPDFVANGWLLSEVNAWAQKNGIKINVNYVEEGDSGYVASASNNQVVYQSVKANTVATKVSEITISVIKKGVDCSDSANQNADACKNMMPDMVGGRYTAQMAQNWASAAGVPITINKITWSDSGYDPSKAGYVTSQSVKANTKRDNITSLTVTVMDSITLPDFNALGWSKDQINNWASKTSIIVNYGEDKYSSVSEGSWVVNVGVGSVLSANAQITVYKSKGVASLTLDNYVGKTYDQFASYISQKNSELGLSITLAKQEQYSSTVAKGTIISYSPGAGQSVTSGQITVVVSLGAEPVPEPTPTPDPEPTPPTTPETPPVTEPEVPVTPPVTEPTPDPEPTCEEDPTQAMCQTIDDGEETPAS